MSELRVVGLASRSPKHPEASNSLIIADDDQVYWQGQKVGRVNVESRMARASGKYLWCTLLVDGKHEGFGSQDPKKAAFTFLDEELVMLPLDVQATYNPVSRKLTVL